MRRANKRGQNTEELAELQVGRLKDEWLSRFGAEVHHIAFDPITWNQPAWGRAGYPEDSISPTSRRAVDWSEVILVLNDAGNYEEISIDAATQQLIDLCMRMTNVATAVHRAGVSGRQQKSPRRN